MPTLYVTEPGARIEKEYGRILVSKEDRVISAIPLYQIEEVVLTGSVGATTQAMLALLNQGAGLTFITETGRTRGRLVSNERRYLPLRIKQFECISDNSFKEKISRQVVKGKLENCLVMSKRMMRRRNHNLGDDTKACNELANLKGLCAKIDHACGMDSIRGIEGYGTRIYFDIFRRSIKWEKSFKNRSRRPPRDPVNALLSLGYSLLTAAMTTAIEVAGLDPYLGIFHTNLDNRPALALDLIEEYRPIIVDSLVLRLVNMRQLKEKDFIYMGEEGIHLSRRGLKKYFRQFNHRMNDTLLMPGVNRRITYQKTMEVQARKISRIIQGIDADYVPIRVR